MDESMTKQDAAKFFQVSERTLDRWRAEGWLKSFKHGNTVRFSKDYLTSVLTKKMRVKEGSAAD